MSAWTRGCRWVVCLVILALTQLGFAGFLSEARAWSLLPCGGFNKTNIDYVITENDLSTQLHGAASDWNVSQNHITFDEVQSATNSDFKLRAKDVGNTGWVGGTHKEGESPYDYGPGWCNANGYWVHQSMVVTVNTNYQQNSDAKRRATGVHELGHVLGLYHEDDTYGPCPGGSGPDYKAIMYPNTDVFEGACKKLTPTADDDAGVNQLY